MARPRGVAPGRTTAKAAIALGALAAAAGWAALSPAGPVRELGEAGEVPPVSAALTAPVAGEVPPTPDTGTAPVAARVPPASATASAPVSGEVSRASAALTAPVADVDPSPPVEIQGPAGWRAPVVPVGATGDGALILPQDGRVGGWWALGAPVGAARGTVLVAGHVDTRAGLGAFATLHGLPLGTKIGIRAANGRTYPYVITARRIYPQRGLPPDLFTRDGSHRLALVTCAGRYDRERGGYDSNLVLYGTPASRALTRSG
ncbi:sortase domain-bontaining protein [Streptomyces sp. NPDC050485]|uniref:class F sortase n=1 Tax=Streptomyces sp. NPDC050485 TaxID=3365617 RepID=UPI0037A0AB82